MAKLHGVSNKRRAVTILAVRRGNEPPRRSRMAPEQGNAVLILPRMVHIVGSARRREPGLVVESTQPASAVSRGVSDSSGPDRRRLNEAPATPGSGSPTPHWSRPKQRSTSPSRPKSARPCPSSPTRPQQRLSSHRRLATSKGRRRGAAPQRAQRSPGPASRDRCAARGEQSHVVCGARAAAAACRTVHR